MVNKQLCDEICQISLGIANPTIATSSLSAGTSDIGNGTTPLNMNNQRITGLEDATDGTDALNRQTADARYYQSSTPLNSI